MRIPSGKVDCSIYFVAVDATDLKTRETGLSSFTVYRSRNGGAAAAYTTPTITEISSANQPGVYSLLVDEDTTIGASSDSEEYCVHITQASMAPVTRVIELYRRDTTSGRTLAVDASGRALSDVDTIKTNPVVNGGTITFPTNETLASTTNITAGTITTATNVTTVNGLANGTITSSSTAANYVNEIADAIWDELLSGHTTVGSAGKYLQDIGGMVTSSGTAQAGTSTSITLAVGASSDNIFDPGYIILTGGTGAGQGRPIVGYNTTTKVCTIQQEWKVTPDNTTTYITITGGERMHTNDGLAQGGSSNTITLNSTAASGTDTLKGQLVWITGGTGADQVGIITAYDGTTKVATMGRNWVVTPDNTSVYVLYPVGPAMVLDYENTLLEPLDAAETAAAVWDAVQADYIDAGTTGESLNTAASGGADILATALPGAYGAGTMGYLIGTNLDLTISSRASQSSVDTLDNFVDTEITDIQSRLPASLVGGRIDASIGATQSNVITASSLAADAVTEIVDGVWDEPLTGATHNAATSSGRRLRQITGQVVYDGTAQGSGTGTNQIQLDTGASSVNGAYDPAIISITGGTGAGQCRLILEYAGATRMATVDRDWKVNPDATSTFTIFASAGRESVNEGLVQAGASTTVTLNALASSDNDAYLGQLIFLRSGTGADQARIITAYDGTTKVATIDHAWDVVPDSTSAYVMLPTAITHIDPAAVRSAVGLAAANLDTQLLSIGTFVGDVGTAVVVVDSVVDAIKAKTDNLTFTVSGVVDSNVQRINDVVITGDGQSGTEFGV